VNRGSVTTISSSNTRNNHARYIVEHRTNAEDRKIDRLIYREFSMVFNQLTKWGVTSSALYTLSILSVGLSMLMWLLRRGSGDRPGAERFGIFVGLWAPTLMTMGKIMEDKEQKL
jgi:hypothetical protein